MKFLLKIILASFFSCEFACAYFLTPKTSDINHQVLKEFDINASFIINSMHTDVDYIQQNYQIKYFFKTMRDGVNYVPFLRKMLEDENIPSIFLYLAMAESNFSPNAISRSKAVGLWQLIPATARNFGLKITDFEDQRKDPIKSTQAAIKYLKYLHKNLKKWYLVAMAYNCGEGRVKRAIKEANSDDINILLDEDKKYIPKQTRLYIKKILAIASISANPNFLIGQNATYLLNQGNFISFARVKVPHATSLAYIAKSINVNFSDIKALNPQLNYAFTPPGKKSYFIYIPKEKIDEFNANFKPEEKYTGFKIYHVKSGDNLWNIAKKFKLKYQFIKEFNNLKTTKLSLKQKIIIPIIDEKMYLAKNRNSYVL